jgi:hypothetical protein
MRLIYKHKCKQSSTELYHHVMVTHTQGSWEIFHLHAIATRDRLALLSGVDVQAKV